MVRCGIIDGMSVPSLSGWRASAALGLGMMAVALVLASYDRAPADAATQAAQPPAEQFDVAHRLPGTWRALADRGGVVRPYWKQEENGRWTQAA